MFQQLMIVGFLGKDPEMRYAPSGDAVTNFNVATNRKYTNKAGTKIEETTWFRVSTWGKTAENCNQYLQKGSKVLVVGRLVGDPQYGGPKIWTAQDGTARANFELSASEVRFLSSKGEVAEQTGMATEAAEEAPADDDIPF